MRKIGAWWAWEMIELDELERWESLRDERAWWAWEMRWVQRLWEEHNEKKKEMGSEAFTGVQHVGVKKNE